MPIIPAFRVEVQGTEGVAEARGLEFKARLSYIARPISKTKKSET
jgi:hypothetical protein